MKIKRTRPFLDTLELEDGDKQLTIVVNIHFERSAPLIRKAQVALIEAEKRIKENPKDVQNLEFYGNTIIALFSAIFGEEQTKQILAFYENAYTDMLTDILPYILQVVIPSMQQYQKNKIDRMQQARKEIKKRARAK